MDVKVGDRVRLISMGNDPHPMAAGEEGTVTMVADLGSWTQVGVKWDSGRGLSLVYPEDQFVVLR